MATAHSIPTPRKARARPGDHVIADALRILENRLRKPGSHITRPADMRNWLALNLGELEHEEFLVIGLDNRHRVIAHERMFRGTINGASVHVREVVKWALARNAAAVVFAHNHPSGVSEPSASDISITTRLEDALLLVDIRTLDHFVIAGKTAVSMREYEMLQSEHQKTVKARERRKARAARSVSRETPRAKKVRTPKRAAQ